MEGRIIWKESEVISAEKPNQVEKARWITATLPVSPPSTSSIRKKQVKVGLSVDFDAISGWLGTGANPENMYVAHFYRLQSPSDNFFFGTQPRRLLERDFLWAGGSTTTCEALSKARCSV